MSLFVDQRLSKCNGNGTETDSDHERDRVSYPVYGNCSEKQHSDHELSPEPVVTAKDIVADGSEPTAIADERDHATRSCSFKERTSRVSGVGHPELGQYRCKREDCQERGEVAQSGWVEPQRSNDGSMPHSQCYCRAEIDHVDGVVHRRAQLRQLCLAQSAAKAPSRARQPRQAVSNGAAPDMEAAHTAPHTWVKPGTTRL
jgi:hypothetical protein